MEFVQLSASLSYINTYIAVADPMEFVQLRASSYFINVNTYVAVTDPMEFVQLRASSYFISVNTYVTVRILWNLCGFALLHILSMSIHT